MKRILHTFLVLLIVGNSIAAELYSKAYGKSTDPAVIFLHGGPGYNAVSFEQTIAQPLADAGFYVVVFDQRGCGRSMPEANSVFTFEEAFADLNAIYEKYTLGKATLIGHSFGGMLGIRFAEKCPEKVDKLILTGSPLSYPTAFKSILARCRAIYEVQQSPQLAYIEMLEQMDPTSSNTAVIVLCMR
jgi:proline iminopeptidase